MDVVGAQFRELESAIEAMRAIRGAVAVVPSDVAVRPLGSTSYDQPLEAFVLAGRFASADVALVARIVADHGGIVISRRRELTRAVTPGAGSSPRSPRPSRLRGPFGRRLVVSRPGKSLPARPLRARLSRSPWRTIRSGSG